MKIPAVAMAVAAFSMTIQAGAQQAVSPENDSGTGDRAEQVSSDESAPISQSSSVDDDLLAELEAAADGDHKALQDSRGAGTLYFEQRAQDPANILGKEVIGNETNPAISIILDMAYGYFSSEDRVRMGGHAPTTNGPFIQNVELAASAPIDPYFRIDLAHSLSHSHIEEVFLTTTALPWNLQLRGGRFKSQIGRHNPTHLHSWDFVTHPLPNQFLFGGGGLTLPGAELSVLLPLPWYVEVVGAVQTGESGAFRTKSTEHGAPELKDFVYPVRAVQFLDVGEDWGLQLGLNAVHGTSSFAPELGNRSEAYGADVFLKWRPIGHGHSGFVYVKWTAEGWTRAMQVPDDLWRDAGGFSDLVVGLGKEWNAGVRGEIWRRTSGKAPDADNGRATYGVDLERGSVQLSYMPSHFSRVRMQYTAEHAENLGTHHVGLLQIEVAAGAHGAHTY